MILRHYYDVRDIPVPRAHGEIVTRTEGLTGGYLAEIARRLDVHGEKNWEEELEAVLYLAPPLGGAPRSVLNIIEGGVG